MPRFTLSIAALKTGPPAAAAGADTPSCRPAVEPHAAGAGHAAPSTDRDLFMAGIVARSIVSGPAEPPSRAVPSRRFARAVAFAATCAASLPLQADDIDVYTARIAAQKKPNVLFVLDYSGSMREDIAGGRASESGLPVKIDVLRDTMDQVLAANVGKIRAGIGSIFDGEASGVRWPISELDADANDIDPAIPAGTLTAREAMLTQLERRGASGDTRTVNALVEAAMYFRGGPVANGGADPRDSWRHQPDSWDAASGRYAGGNSRAAIAASYTPSAAYWRDAYEAGDFGWCADYSESGGGDEDGTNNCAGKVTYDCEFRSKGAWWGEGSTGEYGPHTVCKYEHPDHWAGASYDSPIGGQCETNAIVLISDGLPDRYRDTEALRDVLDIDPSACEDLRASIFAGASDDVDGDCGPEVARALAENPQRPGIPDSTVRTYTVGFGVEGAGQDYLDLLARAANGGQDGGSYSAANGDQLIRAIQGVIDDAVGGSESFVELSVDVDKATFSHDDRAYFSLFTPSSTRAWTGNLKGYFIDADGFAGVDGENAIVSDERGTRFADTAQSFWSDAPDGNNVAAGGASEQIVRGGRTLYTFLGDESAIGAGGVSLALGDAHRLRAANGAITAARLGTGDAERTAALDWLQTAPMGDPLHSRSVSVDYGSRQVVYVMTNQGLLHAIDATLPVAPGSGPGTGDTAGGGELFAFMPARLLPNLPLLATNPTGDEHVYGLDGATTRWHDDANNDGIVNGEDTVLLVLGMRRGGEAYYAVDVTDPDAPSLEWVIDSATPGFAELAQSWSRPALVRVRRGASEERVLMFGGGYDPALDDEDKPVPSRGNAVFVVDRDGNLVRKFTHPAMSYALAADPTVIDSDADGLADRLYAGDLGGQVWRIDFDDVAAGADSRVTRLATLDDGKHRRFFSAPSVALNRGAGGDFLSIALGSGDRTAPLEDDSEDAFFVLRDTDVDKGPPATSGAPIEAGDLYDATKGELTSADAGKASDAREELADAAGWLVKLEKGEKSLSRLVSFEGQLMATTFSPDSTSTDDPCAFGVTRRFYRMDLSTAAPLIDAADALTEDGERRRWRRIDGSTIPSAPVVVFPEGSSVVQVVVDKERVDLIQQRLTRVYWHAK